MPERNEPVPMEANLRISDELLKLFFKAHNAVKDIPSNDIEMCLTLML